MFRWIERERDTERDRQSCQPVDHAEAVRLRTLAESTADANAYEIAAAEFEAIGMSHAAQRCRDRASYYATA